MIARCRRKFNQGEEINKSKNEPRWGIHVAIDYTLWHIRVRMYNDFLAGPA